MYEELTLIEFLEKLSNCSGDEAIDLVHKFQSGALLIEGISVEDVE